MNLARVWWRDRLWVRRSANLARKHESAKTRERLRAMQNSDLLNKKILWVLCGALPETTKLSIRTVLDLCVRKGVPLETTKISSCATLNGAVRGSEHSAYLRVFALSRKVDGARHEAEVLPSAPCRADR